MSTFKLKLHYQKTQIHWTLRSISTLGVFYVIVLYKSTFTYMYLEYFCF